MTVTKMLTIDDYRLIVLILMIPSIDLGLLSVSIHTYVSLYILVMRENLGST